jgi:hypothetical protein
VSLEIPAAPAAAVCSGAQIITDSHGSAENPRSTRSIDVERAGDDVLIDLISRGSVPAFVALFDRTSESVRVLLAADLTDAGQIRRILAASYIEVWWLAGCHQARDADVIGWITGIARRRTTEAVRVPADAVSGPRPTYAELELMALLRRPLDRLLTAP